jgi:hypothetical protein
MTFVLPNPARCRLAWLVVAVALTGCSALQIDVDVYKGPLAHEEDTQVRQFAALAISAKPLLASLRNDFEDAGGREESKLLARVHGDRDALDSYLSTNKVELESRLARFVNGALLSYEDIDEGPAARAQSEFERAKAARGRMADRDEDLALAKRIPTGQSEPDLTFANAYRCWLAPKTDDECTEKKRRSRPAEPVGVACQAAFKQIKDPPCPPDTSTIAIYETLADAAKVNRHSELLFGRVDAQFTARVTQIAGGFLEARKRMRNVLRHGLTVLGSAKNDATGRAAARVVANTLRIRTLRCFLTSPVKVPPGEIGVLRTKLTEQIAVESSSEEARERIQKLALESPSEMAGLLNWIDWRLDTLKEGQLGECESKQGRNGAEISKPSTAWRRFGLAAGSYGGADDSVQAALEDLPDDDLNALGAGNASSFDRARLGPGIETLTRNFLQALDNHAHNMRHPKVTDAVSQLEEALIFFAERLLFVVNNTTYPEIVKENAIDTEGFASRIAVLQSLGNTLVLHANDLRRRQAHFQVQRDAGQAEQNAARTALAPGADLAFDAIALNAKMAMDARAARVGNSDAAAKAKAQTESDEVAKAIEGVRESVIASAKVNQAGDVYAIKALLLKALEAKLLATSGAQRGPLEMAISLTRTLTPPAAFAVDALPSSKRIEPRDVLDQVIAALRHQRIQALAAGDDSRAERLLNAINAAYESRSSSTFLRPASEYLKSVYSSTALQEDHQNTSRNLLTDYQKNLVPGWWYKLPNWLSDGRAKDFEKRTREARQQAEKQYWQNINRVQLSAGGKSNYVVAKDDVGNWYVKAYSADPSSAIKSAQSLALFATGRRINTDLLRRLDLQRRADDTTATVDDSQAAQAKLDTLGVDEDIGLNKVRARFVADYVATIDTQAGVLRNVLVKLPVELKAGAAAKIKEEKRAAFKQGPLETLLDSKAGTLQAAADKLDVALAFPRKNAAERKAKLEEALVDGLSALQAFYKETGTAILAVRDSENPDSLGPADDVLQPTVVFVKDKSRAYLRAAAASLDSAIITLETGLHVVGEAKTVR